MKKDDYILRKRWQLFNDCNFETNLWVNINQWTSMYGLNELYTEFMHGMKWQQMLDEII